ncbi:hypothetical protein BG000_003876 [Podila horticola]|nr:hypothetical protein BG000_003876 [Podila horticola]
MRSTTPLLKIITRHRIGLVALAVVFLYILANPPQKFTPTPSTGSCAVTSTDGKTMYFTAAVTLGSGFPDTFSLDLASAWDTASPSFRKLAPLTDVDRQAMPCALLADNTTVYVLGEESNSQYNIKSDRWSNDHSRIHNLHKFDGWGLAIATDPSTGLIYIPSRFQAPGTSDAAMMEYSPTHSYVATIAMPTGAQNIEAYTFIWIPSVKKFFLFGGFINSKAVSDMFAVDPATKAWEQIVASGEAPSPRGYHCAVSAEGGAKLVVFAGVPTYGLVTTLGSIHVLDVQPGHGQQTRRPARAWNVRFRPVPPVATLLSLGVVSQAAKKA